jgi:hypothetical protein
MEKCPETGGLTPIRIPSLIRRPGAEKPQEIDSRGRTKARVINLKERNLDMLKNDLILRNPLRLMGHENEAIVPQGGFGAVLARAGVGKTALIVQVALNTMLQQKNVLHVSLNDPVDKVNLWYQEVLNSLAHQYHVRQIKELWESIQMNRFIMTFKVGRIQCPQTGGAGQGSDGTADFQPPHGDYRWAALLTRACEHRWRA